MAFDKQTIIRELLQHPRIAKRIEELKLTPAQIEEALPILMDMSEQIDDEHTKYLTSFYVSSAGAIKRMEVRSSWFQKYEYLDNVLTQNIERIDFEDEKDFIKEDERKVVLPYITSYLNNDNLTKKGLYLFGQMGVGKTFLLKRIAKKLAEQGKQIGFVNSSTLVQKVKSTFGGSGDEYDEMANLLKEVDYLFIDDIGAEPISSWFRDEFLFSILNDRMQKQKTTFFSSNYNLDQLSQIESRTVNQKYRDIDKSARLLTRIEALTVQIELKGKNKRF